MPDYAKAKVYKLVNAVDDAVYVGSTCCKLSERFAEHKKMAHRKPGIRVYAHVTTTGGWVHGGWEIVLIEETPCENREQLHAHERRWVEQIGTLNKNVPGRTASEYHEAHRDERNEYSREYHKQYKEVRRARYATNRDAINTTRNAYRNANREDINAKRRARYAALKAATVNTA